METQRKDRLSAKQKRALRLLLDAVMLILLVLMYKKQVISIGFHEIGGLALFGLFLIHLLGNARWIASATKRLFAKGTPGLVRARYIVDALLLLSFLAVGITGILISKVVFNVHAAGNFESLHYFAAALAILLMGVHLGLHADYIFGKLLRKGASKVGKIVLAVVIAAMIAFGGYSLFSSSFVSFLSSPLQAARFSRGTFEPSGEPALDGSSGDLPTDLSELPEFSGGDDAQAPQSGADGAQNADGFQSPQSGSDDAQLPQGGEGGSLEGGHGQGGGFGGGNGQGNGDGLGSGEGRGTNSSVGPLLLIAQYVSIITLFAAATYGIVRLIRRKKHLPADKAVAEIEEAPKPAELAEATQDTDTPQE